MASAGLDVSKTRKFRESAARGELTLGARTPSPAKVDAASCRMPSFSGRGRPRSQCAEHFARDAAPQAPFDSLR